MMLGMDADVHRYGLGLSQTAPQRMLVSELGSLSLEFTRLSQLTGDPKYYDAVQRISDEFEKSQTPPSSQACGLSASMPQGPAFDEDTHVYTGRHVRLLAASMLTGHMPGSLVEFWLFSNSSDIRWTAS